MSEPTAQRTLVKSPPELWAEVSDVESLARHLGEFGEIRITRLDPETTVVWEGEHARGIVELEPSGWGTKVTLTAERMAEPEPEPEPMAIEPEPVAPEPEPVVPEPVAVEPEPEPEPVATEPEPVATEPEPVALAIPAPAPVSANQMLARSGFFSRVFGRRAEVPAPPGPVPVPPAPAPPAPAPDPSPPEQPPTPPPPLTPVPDPAPEPIPLPDPDPMPEPTPLPDRMPDSDPPPAAAASDAIDVEGVLTGALDSLGAAHHRPFSR